MRGWLALLAILCGFALPAYATPAGWMTTLSPGGCNTGVTKIVGFTSGTSATVPSDYCALVEVDALGEGGTSDNGSTSNSGGGGAWANLTSGSYTAGQSITIQIGTGGSSTATCWVSCATLKAQFGATGVGGTAGVGGSTAASVGTNKSAGGNGSSGGGGGGAGGSHGAGNAGSGFDGGSGDAGSGGAGGTHGLTGGNGGAGMEYALTAGGHIGSGGGGGVATNGTSPGGSGGLYGGGAASCQGCALVTLGEPGAIVLQYHPSN